MVTATDFKLNEVYGRAKKITDEIPKLKRGNAWEKKHTE